MQACTLSCGYIPGTVIKENLQGNIINLDATLTIDAVEMICRR
jgi:hypothetical protein